MEKKHCNKTLVSNISHNNTECQDAVNIVKCFEDCYANLYAEEPIDRGVGDMFRSGLPQLPSEEADSLEGDFSLDEILSLFQHMVNNKSPGLNGLPKKIYLRFFEVIGPVLAHVYKLIFQERHLSRSQSLSYIILLCKDLEH